MELENHYHLINKDILADLITKEIMPLLEKEDCSKEWHNGNIFIKTLPESESEVRKKAYSGDELKAKGKTRIFCFCHDRGAMSVLHYREEYIDLLDGNGYVHVGNSLNFLSCPIVDYNADVDDPIPKTQEKLLDSLLRWHGNNGVRLGEKYFFVTHCLSVRLHDGIPLKGCFIEELRWSRFSELMQIIEEVKWIK